MKLFKTRRTPPERRSKIEQSFRDRAADNWASHRFCLPGKDLSQSHFGGKFTAFCHAAEKVALNQEVSETIETTKKDMGLL